MTGERLALQRFVDAVNELAHDQRPANVRRYLEASRELEESRRPLQAGRSRAITQTVTATVEAAAGDVS